ncbi:hypothetical protein [Sphingosinithalassobacter portus]|uniref:hypothetical protein n=1 Tax=Stakelama portus TaxID=2676234 RepID=UPI000D6DD73F|nr:hypothetical protein [Sphingosinithalassobacter portus]
MHGNRHGIIVANHPRQAMPTTLVWLRRAFGLTVLTLLILALTPIAVILGLLWLVKALRLVYPMARRSILSTADGIAEAAFPRR